MKIKDIALSAAYVGQRVVKAIAVGAQEVWSAIKYIVFADPVVEQICVTNFSSDGVGVTEEDAAAVTSLGSVFKGNTEITSFNELGTFGVTELNRSAFEGCTNLSDVDVSNMTVIGSRAFFGSGLEILDAPNVQSFGGTAFESSKLKVIKNIDSIIDLGYSTFASCSQLTSVNLPNNLTMIPNSTFYNSVNLRYFNGKDGILEVPNVTKIGYGAFSGVLGLTEVVCPNIKELSVGGTHGAFYSCKNLRSISLPTSVEKIGAYSFNGCSSLEIEDLNFPFLVELGERSFYKTKLKKISNLGSTVTVIGISTFDECSELTEVDLSSLTNLTTINNSFGTCRKLAKVTLPNSITTLNNYAFINASSLPMINVHSVTTIGNNAFSNCSKLKIFIVENPTPPTLGNNVFSSTPSDMSIYVPDQSVTAYREASGWLDYADRIKPLSEYVES